jgi:membrane protein
MNDQLLSNLEAWAWSPTPQPWARPLAPPCRVLLTVIRGLYEDRLWLHAGYMSFLSLLNLVPLGALALVVSTRLGWQTALMRWVDSRLSPTAPELAGKLVMAMDRLDLAALGYLGLGAVIVAGIFTVSGLEKDLGAIWNTPVRRSLWQQLLLYPAAVVLLPTVVALVLAFGAMAEARTTLWIRGLAGWGDTGQLIYRAMFNLPLLFGIIPYALSWSMLSVVYWLGTPASVRPRAALLGGLVGAILWQATQNAYLNFQFATSTYREIWGYLAQIPLLLVWIYVSWVTVYVGAEFAFAWQYRRAHMPKLPLPRGLSTYDEEAAVIAVAADVIRSETQKSDALTAAAISGRCKVPLRLVEHIAERLVNAGMLQRSRLRRHWVLSTMEGLGNQTVGDLLAKYHQLTQGGASIQSPHPDLHPEILIATVAAAPLDKGDSSG